MRALFYLYMTLAILALQNPFLRRHQNLIASLLRKTSVDQ
jgi:hypothetical protein